MPNKYFGDVNSDFLVEGAKDKGYLKKGGKGYGDGSTSSPIKDYNSGLGSDGNTDSWFEGNKGSVGVSPS